MAKFYSDIDLLRNQAKGLVLETYAGTIPASSAIHFDIEGQVIYDSSKDTILICTTSGSAGDPADAENFPPVSGTWKRLDFADNSGTIKAGVKLTQPTGTDAGFMEMDFSSTSLGAKSEDSTLPVDTDLLAIGLTGGGMRSLLMSKVKTFIQTGMASVTASSANVLGLGIGTNVTQFDIQRTSRTDDGAGGHIGLTAGQGFGDDAAGGNLFIRGGKPTGVGIGGAVAIKTSPYGVGNTSGDTAGVWTNTWTFGADGKFGVPGAIKSSSSLQLEAGTGMVFKIDTLDANTTNTFDWQDGSGAVNMQATEAGVLTTAGFTTTGNWTFDTSDGTVAIATVQTGGTVDSGTDNQATGWSENDTSLVTAGGIAEYIRSNPESYGTGSGDISGVTFTTDTGGGSKAEDTGGSADFSIVGSGLAGVTNIGTTITVDVPASSSISGNAATATTLQNARNIGGISFNGSADITLPGVNSGGNQDTSGNAATATALATARNIGGVSFDGSAGIDLPGVNSTGNQNTSGVAATATALATARNIGGVAFDGTAGIDLPGVNSTGSQNTSGLAATATALATARNIGGVSFDGTAGIDLPGVNASGTQSIVSGAEITVGYDANNSHIYKASSIETKIGGNVSSIFNANGLKLQDGSSGEPVLELYTTNTGGQPKVKFAKDSTAVTGSNELIGELVWQTNNTEDDGGGAVNIGLEQFARIESKAVVATDDLEQGQLNFYVTNSNGSATRLGDPGLQLTGGNSGNIIDVEIGHGAASTTAIAGHTTIGGNLTVTGDTIYHNETVQIVTDNTIKFEGTTVIADGEAGAGDNDPDLFTTLSIDEPTNSGGNAINLPDASGTVALTSDLSEFTGDQDLSTYALIDSQAFTGTPSAPTAAATTNTTQIATTQFVQTELTALGSSSSYWATIDIDATDGQTGGNATAFADTLTANITHSLGSNNLLVQLWEGTSTAREEIFAKVTQTNNSTVKIVFSHMPAANVHVSILKIGGDELDDSENGGVTYSA